MANNYVPKMAGFFMSVLARAYEMANNWSIVWSGQSKKVLTSWCRI